MSVSNVVEKVRQFLGGLDVPLAADFAHIVKAPLPPDADLLDFEFDFDCRGFSIVGFNMDDGASQHGSNHDVLRGSELSWPPSVADAIDTDDDELTVQRAIRDELVTWIARHWAEAGGTGLTYPAYACRHDDSRSYDLANGVWIDDENKWG